MQLEEEKWRFLSRPHWREKFVYQENMLFFQSNLGNLQRLLYETHFHSIFSLEIIFFHGKKYFIVFLPYPKSWSRPHKESPCQKFSSVIYI